MIKYIILFLILQCIIYYIFSKFIRKQYSPTKKKTYYRFNNKREFNSSEEIIEPFKSILNNNQIVKENVFSKADIIFFDLLIDYVYVGEILTNLKKSLFIYGILSIDTFASKSHLYTTLKQTKNNTLLDLYTPKTYVVSNKKEVYNLIKNYKKGKLYILKKNVQKQKGLTITNNLEYLKESFNNNYVVCQELLTNPYLVNGYKINIRQYYVVIMKKQPRFYLYNDGFMYYTPKKFIKDSTDSERHITSGYVDRKMYELNPLSVQQFYKSIGDSKSKVIKENLIKMFEFISEAYTKVLIEHDSNHHTNFIILGADVAIDEYLNVKIMEINKGPDLSYKDERDKNVKINLAKCLFHELGFINHPHNNFINLNKKII
jgi:hypothetical protein